MQSKAACENKLFKLYDAILYDVNRQISISYMMRYLQCLMVSSVRNKGKKYQLIEWYNNEYNSVRDSKNSRAIILMHIHQVIEVLNPNNPIIKKYGVGGYAKVWREELHEQSVNLFY